MLSGPVAKVAFVACLSASVADLLVVDLVVGPSALRPESTPAAPREAPASPEAPRPVVASTTPTVSAVATATPTVDVPLERAARPRTYVVARFESDQTTASDDGLRALATALIEDPRAEIVLEGHTDQRGDPQRNRALSMERAIWAQNRLVELGVSASRIAVVGVAAERPLEKSEGDAAVASNRRVEVRWISGAARGGDR